MQNIFFTTDFPDKHRLIICENLCNLWFIFNQNQLCAAISFRPFRAKPQPHTFLQAQ